MPWLCMSEITTDIPAKHSPFSAYLMSILHLLLVGAFTIKVILLISENLSERIQLLSGFTWSMKISNAI